MDWCGQAATVAFNGGNGSLAGPTSGCTYQGYCGQAAEYLTCHGLRPTFLWDRVGTRPTKRSGARRAVKTLVFADVSEVYAEGAQLAVQVRTFHADPLGELTHLAVA